MADPLGEIRGLTEDGVAFDQLLRGVELAAVAVDRDAVAEEAHERERRLGERFTRHARSPLQGLVPPSERIQRIGLPEKHPLHLAAADAPGEGETVAELRSR